LNQAGAGTLARRNFDDKLREGSGRIAASADGAATKFVIPHGLGVQPTLINVTPNSKDAAAQFFVTADLTNMNITYAQPPPAGTKNLVWSYLLEFPI